MTQSIKTIRVRWNEWSDYSAVINVTDEQFERMDKDELLSLALDADPTPGTDGGVIEGDEIFITQEN